MIIKDDSDSIIAIVNRTKIEVKIEATKTRLW